ncbi:Pimeloyl-ACP methyl ester carboxylesterase [Catalinimonas alkaloidigena]|uniref:Pimeloyl-ACP methyl ester carboxylesterase n=1 Tax=Catalinimonas alkaloidigena TaxID=1075417 RepID=A0A1G9T8A2_9BACT|nr:alpha/beta hydrolase [Catalinimonas alkaloidigena]SDM43894.1 Pimeloyl-ACP methyl ester carboxylesterase [Catalinimonas alkaloidigena]
MKRLPYFLLLLVCCLTSASLRADPTAFTVEVTGQGQPMLLIPGLSSDGSVWDETVAHYRDRYECHVLTLAGFAGQAPLAQPDPFLPTVRDEIIAYIQEQHLEKPIIVGHSLGGFLALSLGIEAPDLVGPLVTVDGLPFLTAIQMPGATAESAKPLAENMRKVDTNQMPEQVRQQMALYLRTMISDSARIREATEWGVQSDPTTIGQAMYELYTTDLRADLPKIKVPTLAMGAWIGYKDYGATRETVLPAYQAQFQNLPHVQLELFDTAKHFIMWDDPEGFFRVLDQFLTPARGGAVVNK